MLFRLVTPLIKSHNFKVSRAFFSGSTTYKEEKIKIGKYNINYLKVGSGPHSVLALPGALGSIWTDFKPQIEGFDREKFTLVAWDPPGYGKSRPPERDFSPDAHEKDADAAYQLMKALNIPKFSVMGWSGGAVTSVILAAKYPDAVQKMVTIAVAAMVLPEDMDILLKLKDVSTWPEIKRKPLEEMYGKEMFAESWAAWTDMMWTIYSKDGNLCLNFVKDVKCPTYLIHGEKDSMIKKYHVLYFHEHIQGARIHIYPEGKHNVHIANAEDFNKRVQEFFLSE